MATRDSVKSEVNVTPFIDVMLVLLIVFMVAAPLATISLPLNLSLGDEGLPPVLEPVFVSLQENGTIYVGTRSAGETAADWRSLSAVLARKAGNNPRRQLIIRADQNVAYADVMRLMDELHREGYRDKTLVNEDVVD